MNNKGVEQLQSGIYKIDELNSDKIVVGDNEKIIILDNGNVLKVRNIELGTNSKLEYFLINKIEGACEIICSHIGSGSESNISVINLSKNNKLDLVTKSNISSNNCSAKINILSICDNGNIKIDSRVRIENHTSLGVGELNQENIFIGDSGKIIGIPGLDINTSNAKASHSLKIEKISREDLFYLESRGIDKQNATHIMLASKINNLFSGIPTEYNYFYENELEKFLNTK